jgi:CDGSH-type Zn-finger protein
MPVYESVVVPAIRERAETGRLADTTDCGKERGFSLKGCGPVAAAPICDGANQKKKAPFESEGRPGFEDEANATRRWPNSSVVLAVVS